MSRSQRRAAQRLKITKYARWIEVPGYEGQKIQLKPCTAYDILQLRELRADEDKLDFWPIVETLIADWTFTDDDGEKLPLTAEAVQEQIPFELLKAALTTAMEKITGSDKLPFAPISSPAPSITSHANNA